ncbi:MAG TPA: MaoC family dehydratase [Pseudobdellovibrionaceae bacterium]|nr:MaoC family dehydratase [Pseudobdellovibrionaceae bacterium]
MTELMETEVSGGQVAINKDGKNVEVGYTSELHVTVTSEHIDLFAKVSGDYNPIHVDEEYAKKSRFGRRIAHGMLSAGFISRALVDGLNGEGIYVSQNLKFVNPVFIGDELVVKLLVTNLRRDTKKEILTVSTNIEKSTGELVVKGEAIILIDLIQKSV